ncbi:unnamed protein product [Moneuplotes crassus]|uniref:Uncharacterized protein n=1 Tax=Euplotes crassus TaxID=5936 RepID=A0AAD1U0N8_EUPCR|nr:unnamed protein product [Moneuplotes crassus]
MSVTEEDLLSYSRYNRGEQNSLTKENAKLPPPVPLIDEITMGPIEKYIKFNKFPWTLMFHILLLLSTFAQIMLIISSIAIYFRSQETVWRRVFGEEVLEDNQVEFLPVYNFYTLSDLSEHINKSVHAYFNLNQQYYTHILDHDPETGELVVLPVQFESFYLRRDGRERFGDMNTNFTKDYIGIWQEDEDSIAQFLNKTTHFRLIYEIEHKLPTEELFIHDCFRWKIYQDFDFFFRNHVVQKMKFLSFPCAFEEASNSNFMTRYTWLNIISIILACCSFFFQLYQLHNIYQKFNLMKLRFYQKKENRERKLRRLQSQDPDRESEDLSEESKDGINRSDSEDSDKSPEQKSKNIGLQRRRNMNLDSVTSITDVLLGTGEDDVPDWSELAFSDKIRLFDIFNIAMIISSLLILIGSVWISVGGIGVYRTGEWIIGFGTFLLWISLPKNYENVKCYNIINNTMINSSSILTKSMIGMFPLLIGVGFFGYCIFISNSWFTNLTFSFQTMNAILYANEVFTIMHSIHQTSWLLSQVFVYAVLILLIIVLQNVWLIIIGDGYIKSKYFHKNNWVKAGDTTLFNENEDKEDPLECFVEHDKHAERSTRALVKMLKADKEFLLTEYYASRGIKYNPHIYDVSKHEKSPEEICRLFEAQMNTVVEEYDKVAKSIENDIALSNEESKKEKEILVGKLTVAVEALEYKMEKINKNMKHF